MWNHPHSHFRRNILERFFIGMFAFLSHSHGMHLMKLYVDCCLLWLVWRCVLHRGGEWRRWRRHRSRYDLVRCSRVRWRHRMGRSFDDLRLRLRIWYASDDLLGWRDGMKYLHSWWRLHLRVERTRSDNMLLLRGRPIFRCTDDRWLADDLEFVRIAHWLRCKLNILHGTDRHLLDLWRWIGGPTRWPRLWSI